MACSPPPAVPGEAPSVSVSGLAFKNEGVWRQLSSKAEENQEISGPTPQILLEKEKLNGISVGKILEKKKTVPRASQVIGNNRREHLRFHNLVS